MELSSKQQIADLVGRSQKILALTHQNPDGDGIGSLLALTLTLKKLGKDVSAFLPDNPPFSFQFLPLDILAKKIQESKDFIISLKTENVLVEKLGYKNLPEEKKLNIIITSRGKISPQDISFSEGSFGWDLIIVLDCPDLDRLGPFYDRNAELFYSTPVINIDHHPGNDYFGKVNWVDLTATSTAEILVSLIESLGREKPLLDPDIATCLLVGLVTDTASFQNSNTTPKSFTVAAQLVGVGARQSEIIRYLYKTKPLPLLKLWGKILTNIKEEPLYRFVWSTLSITQIEKEGAGDNGISGVIDEFLKAVPEIDFAFILVERKGGVWGHLRAAKKEVNVAQIAQIFGGGGHEGASSFFLPETTLQSSEGEIITKIKNYQEKILGLANKI